MMRVSNVDLIGPNAAGMTPWCNEHDLPLRRVRTDDDRIMCWFSWWYRAMGTEGTDRLLIEACEPSYRVVLAQGFVREVAR